MNPQTFKIWIDTAIRDAKNQGMSEAEIYLEFLEQVRHFTTRMMLKAAEEADK